MPVFNQYPLIVSTADEDYILVWDQSEGKVKLCLVTAIGQSALNGAGVTATPAEINILTGTPVTGVEFDYLSGVTSAIQTQLDGKQATITGAATSVLTSNLTASRVIVSDANGKISVSSVTAAELGYVSGVTSAIQTQLNGKQATVTGGATTILTSDLTASRVLVSDGNGKVSVSSVTATEIAHVAGATGNLQGQIDGINADISTFKNKLINGSFNVAQMGSSFTSLIPKTGASNDDTYTLDRWYTLSDGNDVIHCTKDTDAPTGLASSIRIDVETTNKKFGIAQIVESINCKDLIGNTATFSFYAKVSSTTFLDNIKAAIVSWSGTADTVTSDIISAWNNEGVNPTLIANATFENTPANLGVTGTWTRFEVSGAIDTASTSNVIVLIWSDVTETNDSSYMHITGAQLESSASATPLEKRPPQYELVLCQRYLRVYGKVTGVLCTGMAIGTTTATFIFPYDTPMRVNGTAYSYGDFEVEVSSGVMRTVTLMTMFADARRLVAQPEATPLTTGNAVMLSLGSTAFLYHYAEL